VLIAAGTFGFGGYWCWHTRGQYAIAALGAILLMLVLVSWPIAAAVNSWRREMQQLMSEKLVTMSDTLDQMSVLLNLISEQQLLSERAKGVAFREKERDTLRRAIQEEIARQDWEAAMALANEIEASFGYKSEADRFRGEINMRRSDIVRRQIADAIAGIDRHMRGENWGAATREAERLMAVYPADEQVQRLPQDIEARRQQHKRQLLESWHDSVNRHDVDGAIEILKRLDLYLTPAEAESMQEGARHVFKEKLNNLRTQFSVCVQDHNWNEAVRVGEEIMREYPNTQVAREVREAIDTLRQRAQGIEPEVVQPA
jgi:hypothetical protein